MDSKKQKIYKFRYLILLSCCLLASLLNVFGQWQEIVFLPNQVLFVISVILLLAVYSLLFGFKSFGEQEFLILIFALGFIFRLVYTQSTDHLIRQHDVYGSQGHLDYIIHIYETNSLPETIEWQYYQPPAWHFLCACWLKIQTFFGVSMNAALENLQLVSLFCSSSLILISHKLFKLFHLKGKYLCVVCAIVAFHPTFIILSGSINNDVLALTLTLFAVVTAVKWYNEPKFSTMILLAFLIGTAMAVKLSSGLIALGVAVLFMVRFFTKNSKKLLLFGQFSLFGVICVPIALWWQVRNKILFGVPFTYVPMLSENSDQYIGFRSVFERLFDFSSIFENGVYPARATEKLSAYFDYFEYNIPLGALKSSVFGEYYLGKGTPLELFGNLLFWSAALLALLSVIASVWITFNAVKEKKGFWLKVYPLLISATMIFSYVKFCFDFAHFCTMDFRYIAATTIFGALYIGLLLKQTEKNNKMFGRILFLTVVLLTVVMSLSCLFIYGTIG